MSVNAITNLRCVGYGVAGAALSCLGMSCGDSELKPGSRGGGGNQPAATASMAGASPAAGNAASQGGGAVAAAGSAVGGGVEAGAGASMQPLDGGASAGGASAGGGATAGNGGATTGATIVPDPSWTCGRAEGLVDPERGQLVFATSVNIGEVRQVGATPFGERHVTDLTGGTISANELEATLLPGGIDFELKLSNGSIELEQVAMLRAQDGSLIYLRTCGVAPPGESVVRIVPDFEVATSSALAWLNTGNFVGTRRLDSTQKKLELAIYDVSAVRADGPKIALEDPPSVAHQPWDCLKATGSRGNEVFTESVTLGASLSVGASKRGTRNVIPITGGTVSGKLTGAVVNAGADYQLLGGTATLDARYLLTSNDGEVIVVRNCGAFGALIPQFEARSAGPYGFLNTGRFISSDPGSAAGGVKITFYELN